MPYRAFDSHGLNDLDRTTDKSSYPAMVTEALNVMEADGYTLVAIEQGEPDSASGSLYIFHKPDEPKHEPYGGFGE